MIREYPIDRRQRRPVQGIGGRRANGHGNDQHRPPAGLQQPLPDFTVTGTVFCFASYRVEVHRQPVKGWRRRNRRYPLATILLGSHAQKLRIASGLVLFAFAFAHFANHAVGLIGLEAMHEVQSWRLVVTRSWLGTTILIAALAVHVVLGLVRIASRTTWQMPWWEAAQIVLGLAIPFLLFPHIVNTRVASVFFGVNDNYAYELARLWPARALLQYLLLLLVWAHGCIGVHYWLRLWEPYRRVAPVLLVIVAVLPIAALAGFVTSGRQIAKWWPIPAASTS